MVYFPLIFCYNMYYFSYWDLNDDTLFDNVTIEKSNGYRGGNPSILSVNIGFYYLCMHVSAYHYYGWCCDASYVTFTV